MGIFDAFFRAIPWFLPGALLGAMVAAAIAPVLSRRWDSSKLAAWAFLTTGFAFVALTATPSHGELGEYGSTAISLGVMPPSLAELLSVNGTSMNLVAGIGLGLGAAWLSVSSRAKWPLIAALVLPFVAELVQYLVPQLGRSGFLLTDAVINCVGVLLGAAIVLAVAGVRPGSRRPGHVQA